MSIRALLSGETELSRFLQKKTHLMVLRYGPMAVSRAYMEFVARFFFAASQAQKKAFVDSLSHCFGREKGEELWPSVRSGVTEHYFEKLIIAAKNFDWFKWFHTQRVEVPDREVLDKSLEKGKGVLLVTGHFGAVELIPSALALRGYPITVMVHCKTERLRKRLASLAEKMDINILDPKSGSVVFSALKELQNNRVLMTQCDEMSMWRPHPKRYVNFLGNTLNLDKSLDILGRNSGAEVVLALNHRLGNFRYRLGLEHPHEHPAAAGAKSISEACLTVLSDYILKNPAAWYEWKKLKQYAPIPEARKDHALKPSPGLLGQVAIQDACGA